MNFLQNLHCTADILVKSSITLYQSVKAKNTVHKAKQLTYALTTSDGVVNEYFRLITNRDLVEILSLFDEDAVVYEPFSNENGLHGKEVIKNFLKVAFMANAGLNRTIKFESLSEDGAVALVTFERGGSARARFSFHFVTDKTTGKKKIRKLRIQFL